MLEAFQSASAAAVLRWIALCAASIETGVVTYQLIAREESRIPHRLALLRRTVRWSAWAILVAGAGRLAQQALAFALEPSEAPAMVGTLLGTTWGYAWVAQMAAAVFLAAVPGTVVPARGAARGGFRPGESLAALLVAPVIVAPAFQGHAIGSERLTTLAVVADIAHLLAAGVWIGTLFVMVLVTLRGAEERSVPAMVGAFSPWALGGAITLGITGVFASWLHVQELPLLWGSTYGRMVLLKVALVACVLVLGAINWKRLTPHLGRPGGVARLLATARRELVVAAVVFAVTAILVATPLPNE